MGAGAFEDDAGFLAAGALSVVFAGGAFWSAGVSCGEALGVGCGEVDAQALSRKTATT